MMNAFDGLGDDIIVEIFSFQIELNDINSITKCSKISKDFKRLFNPNTSNINKIWEIFTRHQFPFISKSLKCKRWDRFFLYRM